MIKLIVIYYKLLKAVTFHKIIRIYVVTIHFIIKNLLYNRFTFNNKFN